MVGAVTLFSPLASGGGRSLVEVLPETGRKHQIRVHAQWMGYPVTGDKLYGPDEMLYLEFVESGWTSRHEAMLPLKRQALHCRRYEFDFPDGAEVLEAPMLPDMRNFCEGAMDLARQDYEPSLKKKAARGGLLLKEERNVLIPRSRQLLRFQSPLWRLRERLCGRGALCLSPCQHT